jgi:hypothetical protein
MGPLFANVVAFSLFCVALASFAADRSAVTVKAAKVEKGIVGVEIEIEGKAGGITCLPSVPNCFVPSPGKYVIAPADGSYNDCTNVGLYRESSDPAEGDPLGIYCLLSPDDSAMFSCPVTLTNVVDTNASIPYATMSAENTSDKVIGEIDIRYASTDRVGFPTPGKRNFVVKEAIKPNQRILVSTLNAGDEVLAHQRQSNGIGLIYFVQAIRFADGNKWAMPPGVTWCSVMDESAKKAFHLK